MHSLPWEISAVVPIPSGLPHRQRWGKAREQVSRGHSSPSRTGRMKGRILYCKEPVGRTRWAQSGGKARPNNSPFLNGGRRPCAPASLVKAEPELG